MRPDPHQITIRDNVGRIETMLMELILRPRRDLVKWARLTKQTPNIRVGYPGQHLASLVTGVEGTRTGARGHDLRDGSEVKSCSRVDQLDKCMDCKAAVARLEAQCPQCASTKIKRNNDSKWLTAIKTEEELETLLNSVPRLVLLLTDYPNFSEQDWSTLRLQVFEIWPAYARHARFRTLMENYLENIYKPHIARTPNRTPAPKNLWPYSFQFYMCNPVRTLHCLIKDALVDPRIDMLDYVEPTADRGTLPPPPMPISILTANERALFRQAVDGVEYRLATRAGLSEAQRKMLELRDTDHASSQGRSYQRGSR